MRILIASHGYPPTISGVTLVAQKLARAMVARGHQVCVLTASDRLEPYRSCDQGVQLIRVRSRENPFWSEGPIPFIAQSDLEEILSSFRPDVVHTHETAILAFQLARLRRRLKTFPLIATCHYVPHFVAQYLGSEKLEDWILTLAWTFSIHLLNQCDHVVFATRAHRHFFLQEGLKTPTSIISNGIDTTRYHPKGQSEEDVIQRYALPMGPRILFVGRLAKDKKIHILIRAMRYIHQEIDAHLLLVGRGDERSRLEQLAKELALQERIHFLGFVPEEDMPAIYRASQLFAIASTCEVQSLPTLQAMATALPVVAVNAVALPEIVRDGYNGLIVPPNKPEEMAQAILRLLRNPSLAKEMGQRGYELAQDHAEPLTFTAYETLYQQLSTNRKVSPTY
ncbi:MAG: glycosyltransferase [Anaerolineae bacterium]|nr:glycosyltransferase [Anaerolineae bacterium]